MPRKSRIDAPGALHHIMIRGIERKRIFKDNFDRDNFIERLGYILEDTATQCFAWSLMANHVHLLLRTGPVPIATVMRRLLTGYAVSYNRRHRRHGQLFQNRYKSILCQEDLYLLELVKYIHLNPLRAKIVSDLPALDKYSYTGHSAILGKIEREWQDTDYILSMYGKERTAARKGYREYVGNGVAEGRRPDLVGGGLVRSLGGWREVKKIKKGDPRQKGDERILGDSSFVLDVLEKSKEHFERRYRLKSEGWNLDGLSVRIGEIFNLKPSEVLSDKRYPDIVKARSVYCYWAVRELGHTATEIAKMIGITQQGVSRSVRRGEELTKEMNLSID